MHKPITWWAEQIKNNQYFSLARFGDGEFLCMLGKQGQNSHGCRYTPQLRNDLIECARKVDKTFYKGLQRITPQMFGQVREYTNAGQWYNTEEFADTLAIGEFKPFFQALKGKTVIVVSSQEKEKITEWWPEGYFVLTPKTNSYEEKQYIIDQCKNMGSGVFLFACGMAAGPIVATLHGKIKKSFFIDVGHIFDPFLGDNSREYLKDVPQEILNLNLP